MKTTLRIRLVILIVLSSLFLISAFTFIQLHNQLARTQELNVYRSKQDAVLLKEKIEELLRTQGQAEQSASFVSNVKNIFSLVLESGTIESVVLLDKEGNPLVIEGNPKFFFEVDKDLFRGMLDRNDQSQWLITNVDKSHKIANFFVIIDSTEGYVVKFAFSLANLQVTLNQVYGPIFVTIIIVLIANVILAILLSRMLISPVRLLNFATRDVAGGNLDLKVSINTNDELQELAETFNYMTVELKRMKERAENANPLTKLPGNIVIREEVEKRISKNTKFVLIYCDLDNFKAFNDKYGVHAGDKVIMLTADIFKEAVKQKGGGEDFIGHEGGDDFLLLSTVERAEGVAGYITSEFDKRVRVLYSKEDLDRGYIESKARDSEEIKKFPIMTISLAGVSSAIREITTYAQLTNIAAEVKKAAKKIPGSKLLMDRRKDDHGSGPSRSNSEGH